MTRQFTRIRDLGHQAAHECLERASSLLADMTANSITNSCPEGKSSLPCHKDGATCVTGEPWRVMSAVLVLGERAHRVPGDMNGVRVALLDVSPALLDAWFEAAIYFPLELFVAVPVDFAPPPQSVLPLAMQAGAHIFLTHDSHMALDGAHAACFGEDADRHLADENGQPISPDFALSRYAAPDVLVLNTVADNLPACEAMRLALLEWQRRDA